MIYSLAFGCDLLNLIGYVPGAVLRFPTRTSLLFAKSWLLTLACLGTAGLRSCLNALSMLLSSDSLLTGISFEWTRAVALFLMRFLGRQIDGCS